MFEGGNPSEDGDKPKLEIVDVMESEKPKNVSFSLNGNVSHRLH
jgi:hypothetical protein